MNLMEQAVDLSGLPSGYAHAEQLAEPLLVNGDALPLLRKEQSLTVARCILQSGEALLLASAIRTNDKLVKAAESLSPQQRRNADNMMYSRLPELVLSGYASNVETLPDPVTQSPIKVMRNQGGQRLYLTSVTLPGAEPPASVFVRVGVC